MARCSEKDGKWRIYCKARTKKGNEFSFTPYLWSSESEAQLDVPLCTWYKSIRLTGEPKVPPRVNGKVWFLEAKPDESWDSIRSIISSRQEAPVIAKRKRQSVHLDSYQREKKVRRENEVAISVEITTPVEVTTIDMIKSLITGPVMRKPYSDLGERRRSSVDKKLLGAIHLCWDYIAPNQPRKEFEKCVESMFGLGKSFNNMKASLQRAYHLADDKAKSLNFSYHRDRFKHYAGHQGRLQHEHQVAGHIKDDMKVDHSLIFITADYAMKFLPLKDSEAQSEFFGKAGINWHGMCLMWFDPVEEKYKQYYVNQCVEDSAEDGISVATLLSKVR